MEAATLAQIRTRVRKRADIVALTERHPDGDLTQLVNEGIRAFRSRATSLGVREFLRSTSPATLVGTRVSDEDFCEVPWPSGAIAVEGIDVRTAAGYPWQSLDKVVWTQRRATDYLWPGEVERGEYKVWYLGAPVALVSDGDTVTLPLEGVQWVVHYAALGICQADDDMQQAAQLALLEQQRIEERIATTMRDMVAGGGQVLEPSVRGERRWPTQRGGQWCVRAMPETGVTGAIALFLSRWL